MECVFCKIVADEIPCIKLYENDRVLSFMDIQPLNPGHLLVIPKKHAATLLEIDGTTYALLAETIHRLARAVQEALHPDGMNIMQLNGPAANQVVPHVHMHLVPRWEGDGLTISQWEPVAGNMEKIQETAQKIRSRL